MTKSLLYAAALAAGSLYASSAPASEWGCQVLLCVSGSWQATPSCHPPMNRLIAAMKLPGFSWPTCPDANSSAARNGTSTTPARKAGPSAIATLDTTATGQ